MPSTRTNPLGTELPGAAAVEIALLELDGYVIHKEWENGVEMRKGRSFRGWLFALHTLIVVVAPSFIGILFARSIANNLVGYKHRVFVTRGAEEAELFFF
jgi:hypothetical protein